MHLYIWGLLIGPELALAVGITATWTGLLNTAAAAPVVTVVLFAALVQVPAHLLWNLYLGCSFLNKTNELSQVGGGGCIAACIADVRCLKGFLFY